MIGAEPRAERAARTSRVPRTPRTPRSAAHAELGEYLRAARTKAGIPTRALGFSAGHISNVEGGHVTPSRDLLEAYIRLGADRLRATALLELVRHYREPVTHPSARVRAPATLDAVSSAGDVNRHYWLTSHRLEFVYTDQGAIDHATVTVRLMASSPGVRLFYACHRPGGDAARPQELVIDTVSGASLERTARGGTDATEMFFRLDRSLDPGDGEHVVSFRVTPTPQRLSDAGVLFVTRQRTREYGCCVRFHPDAQPATVWRSAGPDLLTPSAPSPDNEVAPRAEGEYADTFSDTVGGWLYGLLWAWPPHLLC